MGCAAVSEQKRPSLYEMVRMAQADKKTEVFKEAMTEITMAGRWPQNAVLELLPVCNLACKMCYVRKTPEQAAQEGGVITGAEWMKIIDQCVDLGVLNFTLTGGECTLHPDFFDIYNHIYDHTQFITLMTNVALITEKHIDLFKSRTPYMIVITVYGGSRETYGSLCGNPGAYDKVIYALHMLRENLIPFRIQMTVTKENVEDIPAVMKLADDLQVRFDQMDSLTSFGNATAETVMNERADHDRTVELLKSFRPVNTPAREAKITAEEIVARRRIQGKPPRPGIRCNAARNTLVINWRGNMQPCTVLDAYQANVRRQDLRQCWTEMVKWADEQIVVPECYGCLFVTKCVSCIAQHYNDTHDFSKPSPRLCWKRLHPEEAAAMEAEFEARVKEAEDKLRAQGAQPQE